jgi:fructose-1,6-bisphosphatase
MYGSSSVFVLASAGEVNGYTLDPNIGEFLLTHPKITIGTKKIYSINEGNAQGFDKGIDCIFLIMVSGKEICRRVQVPTARRQGRFQTLLCAIRWFHGR